MTDGVGEPIFSDNGILPWLCMKEVGGVRLRGHQTLPRWCYRSNKKHWERGGPAELLGGLQLSRVTIPMGMGLWMMQLRLSHPCPVSNRSPNNVNNTKKTHWFTGWILVEPLFWSAVYSHSGVNRCVCCVCLGKSQTVQAA